ncbi:hypothetical protein EIO60_03886|nr:hypothetical protein [Candidatus Pantoea persica]
MNNHVRTGKAPFQRFFDLIRHVMRLHQRQIVVQLQMQLNKFRRAGLAGAEIVYALYAGPVQAMARMIWRSSSSSARSRSDWTAS